MVIDNVREAHKLAEELAEELINGLDADAVEDAKAVGLATSMFGAEIEEYRTKFNAEVSDELAKRDLFDIAIAKYFR
jgi:folate-dependent phosphoribosylglycinamide formyltransferase PurN